MEKTPHPIDVHVGLRIRARRKMLGLSQTQLGNELGVTFQQTQKYERGTNRIGSSRLAMTAAALDVAISYFFEGVEAHMQPSLKTDNPADQEKLDVECEGLSASYRRIKSPLMRSRITDLVRAAAG
jgi:transcriptional regulator with XRE-family HTH domain